MEAQINIAKQRIGNGEKYNGTVYAKFNGKNWVTMSVYIGGEYFRICEVQKSQMAGIKSEIEANLAAKPAPATKNEWLVNEKPVSNGLSYGEMWNKYGTDFE